MLSLTIRLGVRTVHLVRDARDCEACRNQKAHVRANPGQFLQHEIIRAARGDASVLASLRALAARYRSAVTMCTGLSTPRDPGTRGVAAGHPAPAGDRVCAAAAGHAARPLRRDRERRRRPAVSHPRTPRPGSASSWSTIWLGGAQPARHRVTLPDGVISEGTLDAQGRARFTEILSGCVRFLVPRHRGARVETRLARPQQLPPAP